MVSGLLYIVKAKIIAFKNKVNFIGFLHLDIWYWMWCC